MMDSLIRFCFGIDPVEFTNKPITFHECYKTGRFILPDRLEQYVKLYSQAKWVIEYTGMLETKKALGQM